MAARIKTEKHTSNRMLLQFQVAEPSIAAYPDPCTNHIQFATDLSGSKTCTISDGQGRVVFKGPMPGPELLVSTVSLALGLYVVRIHNEHTSRTCTFIKQP